MAPFHRHARPIDLAELGITDPVPVRATQNRDAVLAISDAQTTFGGSASARIVSRRIGGRRQLWVVLHYTSYRVTVGALDPALQRSLRRKVRWLALGNRIPRCLADIELSDARGDDLTIWLRPRYAPTAAASTVRAAR